MTALDDFGDLFPDTVQLASFTGRDSYGRPTFGANTSHKARIVHKIQMVRSSTGGMILANMLIRLGPVPGFTVEGRVTLADGSLPEILAVEFAPDETLQPYYTLIRCA